MTVAISKSQKRKEKAKVKRQVREWGIELKDIAAASGFHRNTVSKALDPEDKYWNDQVLASAMTLIEERQNSSNL
ncbi:hypothetical protein [Chitinophaga sp. YIM B06452]|uniref:hypothetical protein n=1 Tax=Chitinophaga sp. YIM B06452 TaxID=3082158 RepID=UPI0031FEAC45